MILEGYRYIVQTLQDAGIPAVDDPRNLTPGSVLVDPPSVTLQSSNLARLDVTATVVMPGPGNKDAANALLVLVDKIAALSLNVTSAVPGTYTVSGNDLPSYQLTIQLQIRR
jgi:hypothetical protein